MGVRSMIALALVAFQIILLLLKEAKALEHATQQQETINASADSFERELKDSEVDQDKLDSYEDKMDREIYEHTHADHPENH